MGFDISYHPISPEEIETWYFSLLEEATRGENTLRTAVVKTNNLSPFHVSKLEEIIALANDSTSPNDFLSSHVYYIAATQGIFHKFYYTRGSAFSFLVDRDPRMRKYITPWTNLKPEYIQTPITHDLLDTNYSGGIYISPVQVTQLLRDYEQDEDIKTAITDFFDVTLPGFLNALRDAAENDLGLVEASEIVEPNPTNLSETICYTDIENLDPTGLVIYRDAVIKQLQALISQKGSHQNAEDLLNKSSYKVLTPEDFKPKKKNFFQRLFRR